MLQPKVGIVSKVRRHRYPGIRAVRAWSSRLHTVLCAALGADVAGVPHTSMRRDINVPNVVMAQPVAGVVVDEVLLLLNGSG